MNILALCDMSVLSNVFTDADLLIWKSLPKRAKLNDLFAIF